MKKRAKSNSNISTLLTAFILIMLVALFIGAIYRSTDSFSQPIQTFYVEYDGDNDEDLLNQENDVEEMHYEENRVEEEEEDA